MKTGNTHRYQQVADTLQISVRQLEAEAKLTEGRIQKAISRNSKVNTDIVRAIVRRYPTLSKDWLETGEGQMFTTPTDSTKSNNPFAKAAKYLHDVMTEYYKEKYDKKYPKTALEIELELMRDELLRKEKEGE